MFFVASKEGFLVIKNTAAGQSRTTWVTDVREAQPFTTYAEADTTARSRVQDHYLILNTSHIPLTPE